MSLGRTIYLFLQSTLCGLLPVVEVSVPVVCLADCTRVISSAPGRATYELNPYKGYSLSPCRIQDQDLLSTP
jgi:hypothetical protein